MKSINEIRLNGFWYKPDDRIAKMTLEQCLDYAENAIAWDERGDSITTLNDCINRIRELTRWISVEERMPDAEHETFVLAFFGSGRIDIVHCSAVELGIGITHWRRIDKPEGV